MNNFAVNSHSHLQQLSPIQRWVATRNSSYQLTIVARVYLTFSVDGELLLRTGKRHPGHAPILKHPLLQLGHPVC